VGQVVGVVVCVWEGGVCVCKVPAWQQRSGGVWVGCGAKAGVRWQVSSACASVLVKP